MNFTFSFFTFTAWLSGVCSFHRYRCCGDINTAYLLQFWCILSLEIQRNVNMAFKI